MRRIISKCKYRHCQKEFFPELGYEEIQKYCSELHRKSDWKHKNREKVNIEQRKRWKRLHPLNNIARLCIVCSKRFNPLKYHPYQKYCSRKCARTIYYSADKRRINRKIYREKHLTQIKQKDFEYKARIRFGTTSKTLNKEIVLKRDNKICKLCQKAYQVIHHIRYSGKVEDLVCLCRACHASIHQRVKSEPYWIGNYNFEKINYSK